MRRRRRLCPELLSRTTKTGSLQACPNPTSASASANCPTRCPPRTRWSRWTPPPSRHRTQATSATGSSGRQAAADRVLPENMQRPHWYLYYLGTEPEKRGTGIGAAVMRPVLDLCDRHRLPAYAEASSPPNRTSDWPPDGLELGSNAAARRRPRRRLALARSPRRDGGFR